MQMDLEVAVGGPGSRATGICSVFCSFLSFISDQVKDKCLVNENVPNNNYLFQIFKRESVRGRF